MTPFDVIFPVICLGVGFVIGNWCPPIAMWTPCRHMWRSDRLLVWAEHAQVKEQECIHCGARRAFMCPHPQEFYRPPDDRVNAWLDVD